MTVQLIARKRTTYAARDLQPGDRFEASRRDAVVLVAIGAAKQADADPADTEQTIAEPDIPPPRRRRRQYRRRDMIAEGDEE